MCKNNFDVLEMYIYKLFVFRNRLKKETKKKLCYTFELCFNFYYLKFLKLEKDKE